MLRNGHLSQHTFLAGTRRNLRHKRIYKFLATISDFITKRLETDTQLQTGTFPSEAKLNPSVTSREVNQTCDLREISQKQR